MDIFIIVFSCLLIAGVWVVIVMKFTVSTAVRENFGKPTHQSVCWLKSVVINEGKQRRSQLCVVYVVDTCG